MDSIEEMLAGCDDVFSFRPGFVDRFQRRLRIRSDKVSDRESLTGRNLDSMGGGFETLASPKLHGIGDVNEDRIGNRSRIDPFAFGLDLKTSNGVLETAIRACKEDDVQEGNASKVSMSSSTDVALVNFISLGIW